MLVGHTHGGQIPGLDLLAKAANDGFLSGLYNVNGMPLYVSNGTGLWAGFALRIGHPAEITVVVLKGDGETPMPAAASRSDSIRAARRHP